MPDCGGPPACAPLRSDALFPGAGFAAGCVCAGLCSLAVPLAVMRLWPWAQAPLLVLPLPILTAEVALGFGLLALPALAAGCSGRAGAAAAGAVRGAMLAVLVLPAMFAARAFAPAAAGSVWACALLLAVTSSGAAAAGAAWGARGIALAAALAGLPGLAGFLAADILPRAAWISGLSPFEAMARIGAGEGGWWSGLLPGLALFGAALAAPPRRE